MASGSPCSVRAGGAGSPQSSSGACSAAALIAVVGDEDRAAFCRSLGAEATLNHRGRSAGPRVCAVPPMGTAFT